MSQQVSVASQFVCLIITVHARVQSDLKDYARSSMTQKDTRRRVKER